MNFPGVRTGYDLRSTLSASTDFESSLVADWNLDNTDDLRLNLVNALSVSINSMLALKPSLKLLSQNDPSSTAVPLFTGGVDTGNTVLVPLEKLDSIFTLSLVLNRADLFQKFVKMRRYRHFTMSGPFYIPFN